MTAPRRWRATGLILAAILLFLVLAVPNRLAALTPAALATVPLELPVLLCAALAVGGQRRLAIGFRVVAVAVLMATLLLKGADMAIREAFSRPFNPVIDMFVLPSGLDLLSGTVGRPVAIAILGAGILALLALAVLIWAALARWSAPALTGPARRGFGVAALAFAILPAAEAGQALRLWTLPADPPGTAATTRLAALHVVRARQAATDLAAYRHAAAEDPWADVPAPFDLLAGRDVLILFLESYGRASFDNPAYADTHIPTLRAAETTLAERGLASRSLWLTSPIAGGQSWLAHGTLASGLRTGDQARYGAMLASPRQTLFHLAARAGYRTGAVMPAITMPWPEGPRMGFETVLAAADLGYAGKPFNWVTMPDQFTLAAYPDLMGDDGRPRFLQVALISSHAPWTPVPWMIDWADVDDGKVFDAMAASGDTPREVWKDRAVVRDHYRRSLDYALQTALSFVARHPDGPLVLLLGDHQPAPSIAQVEGRDVPLHVIGPPETIARLDGWAGT
ncbi:MAG: sulfatase-like hydrolase/transferase, partial [Pseudomonadota bacterium]